MLRSVVKERYDGGVNPPPHILLKLKAIDKDFELIFHRHKHKWEVWKARGDELIWQMTLPTNDLSLGAIDHLRRFDITQNGMLSVDELKDEWLKYTKEAFYQDKQKHMKNIERVSSNWQELLHDFTNQKSTFVVPKTVKFSSEQIKQQGLAVGFNSKTNKKVYAMKE